MENINFISATQLPEAEGDEISVLCLENGEMKQKPAKTLGGGGAGHWVMYTDNGIVASEGIYEALDNFFVNPDVPLNVSTCYVSKDSETGRVHEFAARPAENIYWYTDDDSGDYFSISGVYGITFYIRENGNHEYYWD